MFGVNLERGMNISKAGGDKEGLCSERPTEANR